ncbi:hypothetical protein AAHE18_18G158900 [Arachis hypogaea]
MLQHIPVIYPFQARLGIGISVCLPRSWAAGSSHHDRAGIDTPSTSPSSLAVLLMTLCRWKTFFQISFPFWLPCGSSLGTHPSAPLVDRCGFTKRLSTIHSR